MKLVSWLALVLLWIAGGLPSNAQVVAGGDAFVVRDLGRATARLNGPWAFHPGDDRQWADPAWNDSGWEHLSPAAPWGAQGHFAYQGFAWYRLRLRVASATPLHLALFVPHAEDAYQVFWNGRLVGQAGHLPPHASWAAYPMPATFDLGSEQSGVLAIRMWKAPLVSYDSGLSGGLTGAPSLGSREAIGALALSRRYEWLKGLQFVYGLALVYLVVAVGSLGAWLRRRNQPILLWLGLFCLGSVLQQGWWHGAIGMTYAGEVLFCTVYQPLMDIATWFLLIYLLDLRRDERLMRWTRRLVWVEIALLCVDGVTAVFWAPGWPQVLDGLVSGAILLPELFPFVLVFCARRKRLPFASWLVAAFALLTDLNLELGSFFSQGDRFTHWTFWQKMLRPLFSVHGNAITLQDIAATLLLFSLVAAVYQHLQREGERQAALEREFHSAQELQRVLIPEELPAIPGYVVSSAYRPAQEVGGDFFQLIPQPGGAALLVLGDVSGKGLTAAMAVALIIGTVRTLAERVPEPAEMLRGMNRRLQGRLRGGFVTCLVLRLEPDGSFRAASAGHPGPFLNGAEFELPGALPLGIDLDGEFDDTSGSLSPGEQLTLYSDGVLEARNARGELYGFERLQHLAASRPDAHEAAEVAIAFGQDDDITVVTVLRLGTGAAARTTVAAPELVEQTAASPFI